jgi:hypothetical protein
MTDTGCPHPKDDVVLVSSNRDQFDRWCRLCGSLGSASGPWQAPSGVVLPGWTCSACRYFNGCVKELLSECIGCGARRET